MKPETKKCPFCTGEILAAAIKCKHCGSAITPESDRSPSSFTNPSQEQKTNPGKKTGKMTLGMALLGAGILLAAYFLTFYNVTAYSSKEAEFIANYGVDVPKYADPGRQQTRNLGAAAGMALTVIGTILIVLNRNNDH